LSVILQTFQAGEKILDRQRYQFPQNWLYADHVLGEWSAFSDIMKRKEGAMQTQVGNLQVKIIAENKAVEQKAQDLLVDWEKEKPVRVSLYH